MAYVNIGGKLVKVERFYKRGWGNKGMSTNIAKIAAENNSEAIKKELKGKRNGNCNVTACQRPGATWWNTSTRAYYCRSCADEINRWSRHDEDIEICYPSEFDAMAAAALRAFNNKQQAMADW